MAGSSPGQERTGTQSIERAIVLLSELATRGETGWRLQDLSQHCGLDRGTVHRILKCLLEHRLAQQRDSDRRYVIGRLSYEFGLSVPGCIELGENIRAAVRRLVRNLPKQTAVSSALRSGDDCVYVARGGVASHVADAARTRPGKRRPLLAGLAGIGIVAQLPADEAGAICARNKQRLEQYGEQYLAIAQALVKQGHREGFVVTGGALRHGINSIVVAFGAPTRPLGSIVVSAWEGDYSTDELREMLPELSAAISTLASAPDEPQGAVGIAACPARPAA